MVRYSSKRVGVAALFAASAFGITLGGCDRSESKEVAKAPGTVNLTSLPFAQVWIDGRSAGTTPLAISLGAGPHEVVMRQQGFGEHRQMVNVRAGGVGTVDATLSADDSTDPETIRQIASAFGVNVDRSATVAVHRGGSFDGGVALLFPREDVRKEGLRTWRVDVTPAYDGTGWLEFRKGKTSLFRTRFNPETLATTGSIPSSVTNALRVGDAVTWGVWFDDGRKSVTTRFELVSKPAAQKKLTELASDVRFQKQAPAVRLQIEAEVLQTYRLYTEALVKLLDTREELGETAAPWNGIVSCLRRLDLEDSSLFRESAVGSTGKGRASLLNAPFAPTSPKLVANRPIPTPAPAPKPVAGPAASGRTTPPGAPPVGSPPSDPSAGLGRIAADMRAAADLAATEAGRLAGMSTDASRDADAARTAAEAARGLADAARTAAEADPQDAAAREASDAAERAAADATSTSNDAARRATEAAQRAEQARVASEQASRRADQAERGATVPSNGSPVSGAPANGASPVAPTPPGAPAAGTVPGIPNGPGVLPATPSGALEAARANVVTLQETAQTARLAFQAADEAFQADPSDDAKRLAADEARVAFDQARHAADEAERVARDLEHPASGG